MGTDIGYAAGPLPEFKSILAAWLELQQRYLNRWRGTDATWIYGERASLSVLAAAAWNAGGIALEEFSTEKKANAEGSSIPVDTSDYGRCDLFISIRNQDFLIEAKPSWPSLRGDAKSRVVDALSAATNDVRRNATYKGARRFAAVFVAPHVSKDYVVNSATLVKAFVQDVQSMERCAVAWFFPRSTRKFTVTEDGLSYPGVAVLIRPLRKTG